MKLRLQCCRPGPEAPWLRAICSIVKQKSILNCWWSSPHCNPSTIPHRTLFYSKFHESMLGLIKSNIMCFRECVYSPFTPCLVPLSCNFIMKWFDRIVLAGEVSWLHVVCLYGNVGNTRQCARQMALSLPLLDCVTYLYTLDLGRRQRSDISRESWCIFG